MHRFKKYAKNFTFALDKQNKVDYTSFIRRIFFFENLNNYAGKKSLYRFESNAEGMDENSSLGQC